MKEYHLIQAMNSRFIVIAPVSAVARKLLRKSAGKIRTVAARGARLNHAMGCLLLLGCSVAAVRADPSPVTLAISKTGNDVSLTWNSAGPGFSYTLHSSSRPGEELWLPAMRPQPWPQQETRWSGSANGASRGFFRLLTVPTADRGKLLSASAANGMVFGVTTTGQILQGAGLPVTPINGVRIISMVYESIDPNGGRTQASAALCLPYPAPASVPVVVYHHGTAVEKIAVPSSLSLQGELMVGFTLASSGYAVVLPDYIGMGSSPGFHPYLHSTSEATASIDALRACRAYCAANSIALNQKLFLCGYSQGGHATLSTQRDIERFHSSEFSITASAPMAGVYDLSGVVIDDLLSGRSMPNPFYVPYLLAAFQSVYKMGDSFASFLAAPYDTTLPQLLDGAHSSREINLAMPANPLDILKPQIRSAFINNPDHVFRQAMRHNNVLDWRPVAPVRLYHCSGDLDVLPANSVVARDRFLSLNASSVQIIDPSPGASHSGGFFPSILHAKQWFDSLR